MPTARKLPSGSWRVRVYTYTDAEGHKHYRSFTAATKQAAEMEAAKFKSGSESVKKGDLKVGEAIDGYIKAKDGVLSPSTIRTHKRYAELYYKDISNIKVSRITSERIQIWISSISADLSAKTVKNAYGLLTASLKFYGYDAIFRVTLPKRKKVKRHSPEDEDVQELIRIADKDMGLCVSLAAFGGMRRGEICAMRYDWIDRDKRTVHIQGSMVQESDGKWIFKIPKTEDGDRTVKLPKKTMRLIPDGKGDGRVVNILPDNITDRFETLRRKAGVDFRFHDLRHYYASTGAVLGIPDTYLADFGGWTQSSKVMKDVYQNKIKSREGAYAARMADYFDGLLEDPENV